MNIVHITPNAVFNDGWGFQDNLLPKYHQQLGHNTTIITTTAEFGNDNLTNRGKAEDFLSIENFRVIRLPFKRYSFDSLTRRFAKFEVYDLLKDLKPDYVFFHGLVSTTIFDVIKYKKKVNPNLHIVQDNHLDYNIGCDVRTFKDKLNRFYFRKLNSKANKYIDIVYGVTPWRVQYAEDYYRIPSEKIKLLIMGADDVKINFEHRKSIRKKIRSQYGIEENEFLIVTGGKIDKKKKIDILANSCAGMSGVKLLIFGRILDDVRKEFESILKDTDNIIYIDWIDSGKVYDYFFAADLVAFPGQHSVLWEQACASKTPCLFRRWAGMEHVNIGGNAEFLDSVDENTIANTIEKLKFTEYYYQMKKVAESDKTDCFLYSKIAKQTIDDIGKFA